MKILTRLNDYAKSHGILYTVRRSGQKFMQIAFGTYDRLWRREQPTEAEQAFQREHQPDAGLISIVVPVYNTDPKMLWSLMFSILAQTYQKWEAVLYDGCSTRKTTVDTLDDFAKADPRFRIIHATENKGISGNTNLAVSMACGDFIALVDHDDLLSVEALWRAAERIEKDQPDLLYSDEDMITENGLSHIDPHYKPDFCPENLNSGNYVCHLQVIRKSLYEAIGGLRSAFDGSQDHDLTLRLSEKTDRIVHLPYTLYTWRKVRSSASHQHLDKCLDAGCRAVTEHMEKQGIKVHAAPVNKEIRLWYDVPGHPTVDTVPFTSYAQANRDAAASSADYLFFADPNLTVNHPDTFMNEMLMYAQQPGIGAVTPVLTDRHGHITHGGFAVGMKQIAACINEGLYATAGGWHDMMNTVHNVSAVSPCAMLIRRDRFLPFDERYTSGLGAVDLCLRLRRQGLRCVFTPHASAECINPALLLTGYKRSAADVRLFKEIYGDNLQDPCYGSRFSKRKANYALCREKA